MMKRVYIWEFPVRLTHWLNMLSIIVLSFTGLYIGVPFIHAISADQYIMGTMRFIHFAFAYLFIITLAIRVYWSIAGNEHANWRAFNPFSADKARDMIEHMKFYLHMRKTPPHDGHGHTASSTYVYFVLLLLFLFEIASGFAMYYQSQQGIISWLLGGWMLALFSGATLRLLHHLVMWFIIAFAIGHIYIAWFLDRVERKGIMSSIFSGYKVVDE